MNHKIIYFEGEGFTSLADFKKACILDIDRVPTIIAYDKGQRLELRNIRSVATEELKDFGTLLKITADHQTVYAAVVIVSFKGGCGPQRQNRQPEGPARKAGRPGRFGGALRVL